MLGVGRWFVGRLAFIVGRVWPEDLVGQKKSALFAGRFFESLLLFWTTSLELLVGLFGLLLGRCRPLAILAF